MKEIFLFEQPCSFYSSMNINGFVQQLKVIEKQMCAKGLHLNSIVAKTIWLFQREMVLIFLFQVNVIRLSTFFLESCYLHFPDPFSFLTAYSLPFTAQVANNGLYAFETILLGVLL